MTVAIINKQIHPKYDQITAHFDVAILEMEEIKFSRSIMPVCLPETRFTNAEEYDGKIVDLIGWGSKNTLGSVSEALKRVSISVFPTR